MSQKDYTKEVLDFLNNTGIKNNVACKHMGIAYQSFQNKLNSNDRFFNKKNYEDLVRSVYKICVIDYENIQ